MDMNSVLAMTLATIAILQAAPEPIVVVNRGVGGSTTRDGLARFARDVEEVRPDHLVIYFGINDSANSRKLVPLDEFRRNLQTMIDRARAVGTQSIVLVTMNPILAEYWALRHPRHPQKDNIDAHMATYDSAIRKVAAANELPIADLRKLIEKHGSATTANESLIRNEANTKSKDGVHLREDGYRLMAELFVPIFRNKVKPGQVVVCLGASLTYRAHVDGQGTCYGQTYPAWLWLLLNRMVGTTDRDTPLDLPEPRAVLLQQSPSGNQHITLFALREAGFDVTWINKGRITELPASATEFRNRYDVVFFGSLALEGGIAEVLAEDQLAALKQFVAEGGGLVTVIGEASGALAELLPVTKGPGAGPRVFRPVVAEPDHPIVAGLPLQWPTFGSKWNSFNRVAAKPGAQVIMEIPSRYARSVFPFLIAWNYHKGRVVCLNSLWAFSTGLNFKRWEWGPAFFALAGRWAAGLEPIPEDQLKPIPNRLWFWRYEREAIPGATERLNRPVLTQITAPPAEPVRIRLGEPKRSAICPISTGPKIEESATSLVVAFANGLVARIDKRGAVGYRTEDGLVLAEAPAAEPPAIFYSGEVESNVTNASGGEFAVLKEAIPEPKPGRQSLKYLRHQVVDAGIEVLFDLCGREGVEGQLSWRLEPRSVVVEDVEWHGVGETLVVTSPRRFVELIVPQHRWAIGGRVDGHFTFRTGCYSQPRGYSRTEFTDVTSQDAGHFRWFSTGQPFQMLGSPDGTLWCYAERPAYIASWLANQAGSGYIRMVNKISVGRRRGRVQTPTLWYLFARTPMTRNLWMASYDFLRHKYRTDFDIKHAHPRPTAMMRFNTMGFVDARRYADALIPLAKRLGFRRIDCGISYVHDAANEHHGGLEALKYLCDKAHEAGIEVFFYCGSAWAKDDFPPLQDHPEWIVRGRDGAPRSTGYPNLHALSLRSGWWDYSLTQYAELKQETGIDGVWLDSWTMPNEYVNYAEREPRPTVIEAIRYVKAIQDLGFTVMVEGQSPVALDSYWFRQDRYADFHGDEFCLFNTTPFAYAGNGLFHLDLFRLLSYNCAMFQDPRLLYPSESRIAQLASHYNHVMNEIHDTIGFPSRVRETSFGTRWESEKGHAIFAHQSRNVDIALPDEYYAVKLVDVETDLSSRGNHIVGTLPARGILIIERVQRSDESRRDQIRINR